jgi:hypothetical protein
MGRPSDYSEELADRICAEVGRGRAIVKICDEDWAPCYATVKNWQRSKPDFMANYARAKEESADFMADEILSIADEKEADPRDRAVRIDARKWVAAKLKPKKYSERMALDVAQGTPLTDQPEDQLRNDLSAHLANNPTLREKIAGVFGPLLEKK